MLKNLTFIDSYCYPVYRYSIHFVCEALMCAGDSPRKKSMRFRFVDGSVTVTFEGSFFEAEEGWNVISKEHPSLLMTGELFVSVPRPKCFETKQ